MLPTKQEMRQALTARQGKAFEKRLEQATVAVCGLGGLGSNIAICLARAGVGRLILVDFDRVDVSNLHRQQYKACQVGRYKTEALSENLLEIAPYVSVTLHTERITAENTEGLLRETDVICEALDNPEAKAILVNTVLETMPGKYLVAASGMAGMGDANHIQTRKITSHFYLCGDGNTDVAEAGSLVSSRVMVCAAHQAHMTLRLLAGMEHGNND